MQAFRLYKNNSILMFSALPRHALLALLIISSNFLHAAPVDQNQAQRIHQRLVGTPPSNTVLASMIGLEPEAAAFIAMDDPAFYNVTLKNFAAPWTNEAQSVFVPLNDYTATVIGIIRDDLDFRLALTGNIIYNGNSNLGISSYNNTNNSHYEELEQLGPVIGDLSDSSILQRKTQTEVTGLVDNATAGVMTTRAAAEAFFSAGTNRAMLRFTFMNHMCTDIDPLKDISRVPDRVRQDVSRSPGGDSRIYMFNCIGCHAGMDGLAGAYAHYDYNESTSSLEYNANEVAAKYLINSDNFKHGYITNDDSWINYWRNGQNKLLGWSNSAVMGTLIDSKGHASGNGAKSLGEELANSSAFARCQVKKAFQSICLHDPDDYAADRSAIDTITTNFIGAGNYSMKTVFAKVAAYCKE